MWSFWSRDPTKDFPYEIGEIVTHIGGDFTFWVMHKGKKKSTGETVSIFRYECKANDSDNHIEKAKNAVKRLKTLRHPCILTYIDSLETDKLICVVSEYVEPLERYLQNISHYTSQQRQFAVSWGLHQVAKGLGFLINDCNLMHNNICMSSIFVTHSGAWRIGGLEYVCHASDEYIHAKAFPSQQKYTPPERSDSSRRPSGTKWSADSWGFGCLIWEVFNGQLPDATKLKTIGKIPKSCVSQYTELISSNANNRLSPSDFIVKCRSANGFLKNTFIDAMLFLEEIQIKEPAEKNRFFTNLDSHLDTFPDDICKNKILPQLVTAFEYSNAGSAILGPLFKIGKSLEEDEYQKKIVPCVVKLFACKDRATRAKLLQQMEVFINYIQPNVVNDQVFPHVMQGFLDSNPLIREQTVKCMLYLAPKLNYHNLNEEVLKNFARLQSRDEEGGIRTNTTVCLGKIANYLYPQTRQTVLIPAFLRSMRDPFPPCRIAGILALSATQNFYSLRECATRVMPALCHLTMDPEKQVREQSFKALKGFVSKLEKVSEDPSLAEQMEADLNAAGSSVSATAGSWAGWAMTSLASKFYRSKTLAPQTKDPSQTNVSNKESIVASEKTDDRALSPSLADSESRESMDDIGDEDWGNMDAADAQSNTNVKKTIDGWDNDDWNEGFDESNDTTIHEESVNESITNVSIVSEARKTNPETIGKSDESDDFFSQFGGEKSSKRRIARESKTMCILETNENAEMKSSVTKESYERTKVKSDERRQNVNERRNRRGGAMKLGAQKIS